MNEGCAIMTTPAREMIIATTTSLQATPQSMQLDKLQQLMPV